MFLPWSFFILNFFYLVLDVLVATSFAAALSHIARRNGNYAQSIRWIKQAGSLEMVKALWTSFGKVTRRHWLALFATFIGGYALTGIVVGAKSAANFAIAERNSAVEVIVSKHFIEVSDITTVPSWSTPVDYATSMEVALTEALTSTKVNPEASPTKRYRPRLSDYELACDRLDARVYDDGAFNLPNDGCATLTLNPTASGDPINGTGYIIQKTKGRAKVVVQTQAEDGRAEDKHIFGVTIRSQVTYLGQDCITSDTNLNFIDTKRIGIVSSPITVLTKCLLSSGEMVSLSLTSIPFSVPTQKEFHAVASSIFKDQDELVSDMQESVNNGTLTNLPADPHQEMVVIEMKVVETEVRALVCSGSRLRTIDPVHISCAYTTANVLITKPRPVNPDILHRQPGNMTSPTVSKPQFMFSFYHLLLVSTDEPLFAIPKIIGASKVAAAYFANVGPNFILDWERSTLYVAYNRVDIIRGYDVPGWLFWTMVAVMVGSLAFWGATEYWVEAKYRRSLYFVVSMKLTDGETNTEPRLHQFDTKTQEFEGRRIVSERKPQKGEKKEAILGLMFDFLTDY
ncbi:hypothetical protein K457DRAFT_1814379 [Linnemannia elongata AG-77]|uniref:Uncharacterized protein n=1 Tax=Linnemannia elongata AG-77 TaxID=1314771 RepID=A0A197KFN8_9FUNG|nr:hypothetical protein K457DRAFT_1814379 [Linnemannia elongata AG-77]